MISRRQFTGLVGGARVCAPYVARAQSLPVIRLGNAAGIIDPQLSFLTVGQHPRVGYYAEEGCVLDILNMSSAGQTLQAIATAQVETSAISPPAFLGV